MPYVQYVSMHLLVEIRFSLWTVDLIMKLTCNLQLATLPRSYIRPGNILLRILVLRNSKFKKVPQFYASVASPGSIPVPSKGKLNKRPNVIGVARLT